jgi:hypothetical protein
MHARFRTQPYLVCALNVRSNLIRACVAHASIADNTCFTGKAYSESKHTAQCMREYSPMHSGTSAGSLVDQCSMS